MSAREKKLPGRKEAERLSVVLLHRAKAEHWPFFQCFDFTFVRLAQWIVFGRSPHDVAAEYYTDGQVRYDIDEYLDETHWADIVRTLEGFIAGGRPTVMKAICRRLKLDGYERPPFRVYSPWPLEEHIPETAINMKRGKKEPSRDDYTELPWTFRGLLGSTWRYVWTGTLATITNIKLDRFCEPHLVIGKSSHGAMDDLGLWHRRKADGRQTYVVDNAVRVDHLDPEQQLTWYRHRLAIAQRGLVQSGAAGDKWQTERLQGHVTDAISELRAFEEQHGLRVSVSDIVNEAISSSDQASQLILF